MGAPRGDGPETRNAFSPQSQLHEASIPDWDQFSLLLADVNGDTRDDVVWVHAAATTRIYAGLAKP